MFSKHCLNIARIVEAHLSPACTTIVAILSNGRSLLLSHQQTYRQLFSKVNHSTEMANLSGALRTARTLFIQNVTHCEMRNFLQ